MKGETADDFCPTFHQFSTLSTFSLRQLEAAQGSAQASGESLGPPLTSQVSEAKSPTCSAPLFHCAEGVLVVPTSARAEDQHNLCNVPGTISGR